MSLYLGDEVVGRGRRDGELGGVASAFAENAVLVQNGSVRGAPVRCRESSMARATAKRVATGLGMEVFGGTFEALANFADGSFIELLAKLFLLLRAEFDQVAYQLRFAPGLPWDFQAA